MSWSSVPVAQAWQVLTAQFVRGLEADVLRVGSDGAASGG